MRPRGWAVALAAGLLALTSCAATQATSVADMTDEQFQEYLEVVEIDAADFRDLALAAEAEGRVPAGTLATVAAMLRSPGVGAGSIPDMLDIEDELLRAALKIMLRRAVGTIEPGPRLDSALMVVADTLDPEAE